jgi:anti-anti-sigma factor
MSLAGGLELEFTRAPESVVVTLRGELDAYSAPQLRDRLADVIDGQGNLSVSLDLAGLSFMDSTAIGVIVGVQKELTGRGGQLVLREPKPQVFKILEVAGLTRVFTITRA